MNPFPYEDSDLDDAIASAYADLQASRANDEDYQKIVDQLSKLYKLRNDQRKLNLELHQTDTKTLLEEANAEFEREQATKPFYQRVDPNTALTVLGNLLIGYGVLKYERTGVIHSRIRDFMQKL